jgi:hypothetical protein
MLEAGDVAWLASTSGRQALEEASELQPCHDTFLACLQRLERRMPRRQAGLALEQVLLRRRAAAKFPLAWEMLFERQALEQSTSSVIAVHRASRFAGASAIFDLGCGLGGDGLALAEQGPVIALDRNEVSLRLLRHNAEVAAPPHAIRPIQGDLRRLPVCPRPGSAAFFDLSRREAGRRRRSPQAYQPPLTIVLGWLSSWPNIAVKVSPAIDLSHINAYPCEIEFISLHGELKEACLWFGEYQQGNRRATLLPGGDTLVSGMACSLPARAPGGFLYEPDPAVLRAGLVADLGIQLQAWQIDRTLGLLSSNHGQATPFARLYCVEAVLPATLKLLRTALRQRSVGHLALKKRGSAVEVDDFARRLKLKGDRHATLLMTRLLGRPQALLVEPLEPAEHVILQAGKQGDLGVHGLELAAPDAMINSPIS